MSSKHIEKWEQYRDTRVGTYEYRARTRYKAVADRLFALGLSDSHTVADIGAGTCQFGRYLRERGFRGIYLPVDAVLDGTDLETWTPPRDIADFVVSIEVAEHLHRPRRHISGLWYAARRGVVLTTPNPAAVDVLGCDPTHVSEVPAALLRAHGFTVEAHSWFGTPEDTLLAWMVTQ